MVVKANKKEVKEITLREIHTSKEKSVKRIRGNTCINTVLNVEKD